jgi:hypothetical protein
MADLRQTSLFPLFPSVKNRFIYRSKGRKRSGRGDFYDEAWRMQSAATVMLTKIVGVMSSLVLAVGRDG